MKLLTETTAIALYVIAALFGVVSCLISFVGYAFLFAGSWVVR